MSDVNVMQTNIALAEQSNTIAGLTQSSVEHYGQFLGARKLIFRMRSTRFAASHSERQTIATYNRRAGLVVDVDIDAVHTDHTPRGRCRTRSRIRLSTLRSAPVRGIAQCRGRRRGLPIRTRSTRRSARDPGSPLGDVSWALGETGECAFAFPFTRSMFEELWRRICCGRVL